MSHLALYRKYRPQNFTDVVGQDSIVDVLSGAIKLNKISHAYIFHGSRGTGKTTMARIFAHALKVEDADIYEMDAASNRGVDDVRALREAVYGMPLVSPYKVYIIDEAHMLTKEAWNALLKTLEEPPKHVIFILATTEKDRILETILSRCQIFSFNKPTRDILAKHLTKIAKKENLNLEDGSAELMALLADGSFRDALGILEKVSSFSKDNKISLSEVERVTGAPSHISVSRFVESLASKKVDEALAQIESLRESGSDLRLFISLVLEDIRRVLLLRHAPQVFASFIKPEISADDEKRLQKLAVDKNAISADLLSSLLHTSFDLHGGRDDIYALEAFVMKIGTQV